MILKVLLVLTVIGIVYFMFIKKKPLRNPKAPTNTKKTEQDSNDMIECSTCGIYAQLDDTIISNNKYYCCDECVKKA